MTFCHNESLVCAVSDHLLPKSEKEPVEEPPQLTEQEFSMNASQEARFSKTIDVRQFFRTRPLCSTNRKSIVTDNLGKSQVGLDRIILSSVGYA